MVVWPGPGPGPRAAGDPSPTHGSAGPAAAPIPAAIAAHFTATFFSFLATPLVTVPEAFAVASHGSQALCSAAAATAAGGAVPSAGGEGPTAAAVPYSSPPLPALVSAAGERPALPDSSSIPLPPPEALPVDPAALTSFPGAYG